MLNRLPEFLPDSDSIRTDIVIERSLAGSVPALLKRIGFADKRLVIVCDEATHSALGQKIVNECSALNTDVLILKGKVRANETALELIRSKNAQALVAVGSGTISDLCKYASFLSVQSYAVFPTAPSMNGYLSANASVTLNGIKESKAAYLPAGVFCDISVIAAAPHRLIKSGLGDSLCRSTAQADWLLSHLLLDTPYTSLPFDMLKPFEEELFAHVDKLTKGDIAVVELLLRTLLASGLGMTIAKGSYPASQGEHMIAHTMEMKHGTALPDTFHGEQIGVTTLTMARIQEELLSKPLRLPRCPPWEKALSNYMGPVKARHIAQSVRKKYAIYDHYDEAASKLARNETRICDAIRQITVPEIKLREVLAKAQAPTTPHELGWNESDYDIAVSRARFTRDRFTFLDLL